MLMRVTTTQLTKSELIELIESKFDEYTSWDTIAVVTTAYDEHNNKAQSIVLTEPIV